ncbi:hypothetical protein DVH24_016329 [Malus domestica]|uniref:Uncharacterized protein n=1 Tax=Malus domestica TaxID=3750 RepID=A0A498HVH1_MALDO|nr:hypothetical protein DVH24_016329 [Malus domestica]
MKAVVDCHCTSISHPPCLRFSTITTGFVASRREIWGVERKEDKDCGFSSREGEKAEERGEKRAHA